MFRPEDDWTVHQSQKKKVHFDEEESIEIKLEEDWTPVNTIRRELRYVDLEGVPSRIIRSIRFINDVQAYQEGMKV